jgi:hypothetical protein
MRTEKYLGVNIVNIHSDMQQSSMYDFTADTARKLAKAEKDRMEKSVETLANDIIDYIRSVYKEKVQNAISEDGRNTRVKFYLPKSLRKRAIKVKDKCIGMLENKVNNSFTNTGFIIKFKVNSSYSCDSCCLISRWCTKRCKVTLSWDKYDRSYML